MERKVLTYEIPYTDATGEEKAREVRIKFVSIAMRRDYYAIDADILRVRVAWRDIQLKAAEIAAAKLTGIDAKEITKLEKEKAKLEKGIESIGSDFFTRRVDLIREILGRNGYADDEILGAATFWDTCVDVDDINAFLEAAITKDETKDTGKTRNPATPGEPSAITTD